VSARRIARGRGRWSLLALLAACRVSAEPPPANAPAAVEPAAVQPVSAVTAKEEETLSARATSFELAAVVDARDRLFAGTRYGQDFLLTQLSGAQPLSFKPIKSTGGVFRVRLAGPIDAAWKPVTSGRPLGPSAEVAAFRVARCLEFDNVPPAVWREFPATLIRDRLDPEGRSAWPALREQLGVADDDSTVLGGAAIFWIPQLADIGLESRRGLARVGQWLSRKGELPEGQRALAASLSNMLAFDYLIGNFDRWSGGNVGGDAAGTHTYIRDHDLAFPARMNEKLHRRLWHDVQHAERFSRRFRASLKGLRRECVERELAQDPLGARGQLLLKGQLNGVFDRREALLSHIETLIEQHGESSVLAFE
jgi:hypothetical protein